MAWQLLETGKLGDIPLHLFAKEGEFMVRVEGWELMNSLCHTSEMDMASLARISVKKNHGQPRILIGGLGLGYTLSATIQEFGHNATIEVAEKSADVLAWYRQYFRHKVMHSCDDNRVIFKHADVGWVLQNAEGIYDVVMLDVDNGPQPVVDGGHNRSLYEVAGLKKTARALVPDGVLLLWSAFESKEFVDIAEDAGFRVEVVPIGLPKTRHAHYIYRCAKS